MDVFNDFVSIIRKLRSKEGCPWDREQTHESLKTCLLEEAYETIDAINNKDMKNLCEELGDLLLQVVLHSVIAEETNEFSLEEVIKGVSEKMIRRHPHVFSDVKVSDTQGVLRNWEDIKTKEKNPLNLKEEVMSVPKALPATLRAEKIQRKAAKSGMDFEDTKQVFD